MIEKLLRAYVAPLVAAGMLSCGSDDNGGSGAPCRSDEECKGGRVCKEGVCRDPTVPNNGGGGPCEIRQTEGCEDFTGCYYPSPDAISIGWDEEPVCVENHSGCRVSFYSFNGRGEPNCDITCDKFDQSGSLRGNVLSFSGNQYILCDKIIYLSPNGSSRIVQYMGEYMSLLKIDRPVQPNNCCIE